MEPASLHLSLSLEGQTSFVVVMTGPFLGGSKVKVEKEKYRGLWLKKRNEEKPVEAGRGGRVAVMAPGSLLPSLPSSELILSSVTSRLLQQTDKK